MLQNFQEYRFTEHHRYRATASVASMENLSIFDESTFFQPKK